MKGLPRCLRQRSWASPSARPVTPRRGVTTSRFEPMQLPCKSKAPLCRSAVVSGGDEGARTLGLRLAKPALSQLSYIPICLSNNRPSGDSASAGAVIHNRVVGLTRFELVTSRLSAGRSDQLSYRPNARINSTHHPRLGQELFSYFLRSVFDHTVVPGTRPWTTVLRRRGVPPRQHDS